MCQGKSDGVGLFLHQSLNVFVSQVYELDGTVHDTQWVLEAFINTSRQFVCDHPDFSGVKFIYTGRR